MNNRQGHKNFILLGILILATCLRLYKLDTVPPHLTPDEAALGYNAYSILQTGKDEYGQVLPVIFKSFGDYKPGLYIYSAIPSIAILGLNEFSVRLPSAISGILAVFLMYLLINHLFPDKKNLANISALFLALSPWHIHFSRGAWEINLALTLTLAGIYFFITSFKNTKNIFLSAAFFALTFWAYQGAKLSASIVLILLFALYFKELIKFPHKKLVFSGLVAGILLIPIVLSFFTGKTGRLSVFSIFSHSRPTEYLQTFLDQENGQIGDLNYYLFHSEALNTTRGILGRYFNHFSGRFLFFEGDWPNPRHSAPNHGVMMLTDFVFILVGIVAVGRAKKTKEVIFILLWLAFACLPSVLSRDQVHAVRSYSMLIPLVFLSAIGFWYLVNKMPRFKVFITTAFLGLYLLNFVYYLDAYFVHLPIHDSKYWEYGYKQIVETVLPIEDNYKEIKIQQSYAQPYIFFLFYGAAMGIDRYQPAHYQAQAHLRENEFGDVGQVDKLNNICFCALDWSVNRGDFDTLFVADTARIPVVDSIDPEQFTVVKEIKYLDNLETAFRIVAVKKK